MKNYKKQLERMKEGIKPGYLRCKSQITTNFKKWMGDDHRNEHSLLFWKFGSIQSGLVTQSMSDSLQPHGLQHNRPPCPSPSSHELTQTHVHWVGDAIQPSHPLSSPSPPTFNLSQHQGLFQWVSSLHQVAKYWSFSFNISPSNEYSELISFKMDWNGWI